MRGLTLVARTGDMSVRMLDRTRVGILGLIRGPMLRRIGVPGPIAMTRREALTYSSLAFPALELSLQQGNLGEDLRRLSLENSGFSRLCRKAMA